MIVWMIGMLYLLRLFVCDYGMPFGSAYSERFKLMERRFFRQLINPAMTATWGIGMLLSLTPGVIG